MWWGAFKINKNCFWIIIDRRGPMQLLRYKYLWGGKLCKINVKHKKHQFTLIYTQQFKKKAASIQMQQNLILPINFYIREFLQRPT